MTTRKRALLIFSWGLGGKAGDWVVIDVSVTSPLKSEMILEASVTAATVATKNRELLYDGHTCEALGGKCLPIVIDCLGRQSNQYLFQIGF